MYSAMAFLAAAMASMTGAKSDAVSQMAQPKALLLPVADDLAEHVFLGDKQEEWHDEHGVRSTRSRPTTGDRSARLDRRSPARSG